MKLTVFQKLFCFSSFQYADSLRQGQVSTHSLWSTANRNVKHSTRSEPNYNDNDVVQRPFSAHSRPAYLILISPLACTCKYADKTNMSCLSFLRAQAICCRCCTAGFSGRCWITARRRSTVARRSTIVDVPTAISATYCIYTVCRTIACMCCCEIVVVHYITRKNFSILFSAYQADFLNIHGERTVC